jgi:hypothetical protein
VKEEPGCQALVAYILNPPYSGGRDQEDFGLKSAWTNRSRPYLKKTHHRKGLMEWLNTTHTQKERNRNMSQAEYVELLRGNVLLSSVTFLMFFFCGTRDRSQGLMHAR